jgi:hypothetical protein
VRFGHAGPTREFFMLRRGGPGKVERDGGVTVLRARTLSSERQSLPVIDFRKQYGCSALRRVFHAATRA